jgi:hypothetical protein
MINNLGGEVQVLAVPVDFMDGGSDDVDPLSLSFLVVQAYGRGLRA